MQGKTALRYPGPDVDAMRAVAKAHSERDLRAFEDATKRFPKGVQLPTLLSHFFLTVLYSELVEDPIVHTHLSELYNTLLEQVCQTFHVFSPSPHTTLLSDE